MHTSISLGSHKAEVTKMVPTEDGRGKVCRVVADRVGHVDLIINTDKLSRYARQALLNKGGKSKLANGAIVFSVARHTMSERKRGDEP